MDGETASYIFFCSSIFSSAVRRMVRVSVCFLLNGFSFRTCFFAVASLIRFFWLTFSFRKEKVSGSGNAAGLLPDCVREVRRRKAVDIHALCLPQPRTQSAGKTEIQLDIFICLRYNIFEKQSDTILFINKYFVECFFEIRYNKITKALLNTFWRTKNVCWFYN